MWYCDHCDKEFVYQSGLSRYVRLKHRKEDEEDEKTDEEETETEGNSSEDDSDEDERKDSVASSAWKEIITGTAEKLKESHNLTVEELLSDEYLLPLTIPTVMRLAFKKVEEGRMLTTTRLYKTVKKEEDTLVKKKDYPRWEAHLKAMENRKYYIKGCLEHFLLAESEEEQEDMEAAPGPFYYNA